MFDAPSPALHLAAMTQVERPFVPTTRYVHIKPKEPVQDDPYARGLADGQELAAAAFEVDRMTFEKLILSADVLQPETPEETAALIRETVLRLVVQIVGNITIDTVFLEQQVLQATALISEADCARTIWLNPEDHALLVKTDLALVKKIDPLLPRGNLRIDCSDGWIEHGVAIGIEKLRSLIGVQSKTQ
jgi:flagellar assembly protein FliH